MGSGIVLEVENSGAPVIEITTLLLPVKHAAHVGTQNIRRGLAGLREPQYGEFVNSIDVNRRRFTVERVFLNNVCPSGLKIGASVTAEQLFAPVWDNGVVEQGQRRPSLLSNCLLPVHKIREIKLSDVVNWNTYAVMSIRVALVWVGSVPEGVRHTTGSLRGDAPHEHDLQEWVVWREGDATSGNAVRVWGEAVKQ